MLFRLDRVENRLEVFLVRDTQQNVKGFLSNCKILIIEIIENEFSYLLIIWLKNKHFSHRLANNRSSFTIRVSIEKRSFCFGSFLYFFGMLSLL